MYRFAGARSSLVGAVVVPGGPVVVTMGKYTCVCMCKCKSMQQRKFVTLNLKLKWEHWSAKCSELNYELMHAHHSISAFYVDDYLPTLKARNVGNSRQLNLPCDNFND